MNTQDGTRKVLGFDYATTLETNKKSPAWQNALISLISLSKIFLILLMSRSVQMFVDVSKNGNVACFFFLLEK